MNSQVEIYKTPDSKVELKVSLENDTVWLNRQQISLLFDRDVKTIGKHINNLFKEGELVSDSVVAKFATTAEDGKTYQVEYYNLDVIISVGYRVKSIRGTQFRQWAAQRIKEYLVQGYAINEKRLAEKQQQVEYLKTGIRILSRSITQQAIEADSQMLQIFAKGLELLDDYDHEQLDAKGKTIRQTVYPDLKEYLDVIAQMKSSFASGVFAIQKDKGFESSTEVKFTEQTITDLFFNRLFWDALFASSRKGFGERHSSGRLHTNAAVLRNVFFENPKNFNYNLSHLTQKHCFNRKVSI